MNPNENEKLDRGLKIAGISSCVIGLIALVTVGLIYFQLQRATQNEANIDMENYHAMLQAVKLVMLGFVPILAVIFIFVGTHILYYLQRKKKLAQAKPPSAE